MKVGLIGPGIMGRPMTKNLLGAGYDLTVSDLSQASVDEVVATEAKVTTNTEVGETCDVVLTMVPNSPQVRAIMLGEDGVAAHMESSSVFINTSSIDPVVSREITVELAKRGIEVLDVPVSSGEPKVIDGILSFMVGGKKGVFDQRKDVLGTMGASVVHCDDVGMGNIAKLTNQIVVVCNIQALSEALILAKMAGVDPELVFQAVRGGLAGSTVMNVKASVTIEGNDEPGFEVDLCTKDLNNALDCVHTISSPLSMTVTVQGISQWLHNNGCGQGGHSSIVKYYKKLTGVESL